MTFKDLIEGRLKAIKKDAPPVLEDTEQCEPRAVPDLVKLQERISRLRSVLGEAHIIGDITLDEYSKYLDKTYDLEKEVKDAYIHFAVACKCQVK